MQTKMWPFSKEKSKGFPVYVEMPSVVNNMVAQQLAEDKAKYRAIINNPAFLLKPLTIELCL